jgi:hypothetical protein
MSRFDAGSRLTVKPSANVYTALALIGFLAIAAAVVYALLELMPLVSNS